MLDKTQFFYVFTHGHKRNFDHWDVVSVSRISAISLHSYCCYYQTLERQLSLMNPSKFLHKKKITPTQILYLLKLITPEISVLRAVLVALVPTSDRSVCIVFTFGQMTPGFVYLMKFSICISSH